MARHANHYYQSKQYKMKKIIKHSMKVFAGGGIWYLSTSVHDTPLMVLVALIGMLIQTIIEELIGE